MPDIALNLALCVSSMMRYWRVFKMCGAAFVLKY